MAEDRVDCFPAGMGAGLLASIWGSELPLFLRFGKLLHRRRIVDGKLPAIFVAGNGAVTLPNALHN